MEFFSLLTNSTQICTTIHNIIVGRLWMENHGQMTIRNHATGATCDLDYKAYSIFSSIEVSAELPAVTCLHIPSPSSPSQPRTVTGDIKDVAGEQKYLIKASWDRFLAIARPGE